MAIKRYSLLKARVVGVRVASGSNPHYQIRAVDTSAEYRIAVNVQSQDGSDLQYRIDPQFRHPLQHDLDALPLAIHAVTSAPGGLALDYIRGNPVDPRAFVTIPMNLPGPD